MIVVIHGTKDIERESACGKFFCPVCKQDTIYSARVIERWATFFLIRTYRMEEVARFVRCNSCGASFRTEILMMSAEEMKKAFAPWTCDQCGWSNPAMERQCVKCKKPPQMKPVASASRSLMPIKPPTPKSGIGVDFY